MTRRWPPTAGWSPRDEARTAVATSLPRNAGPRPPSLNPAQTRAPCALLRAPERYTGTALVGIATMHKSNAVPVFSAEEATELAKMRR